MQNNVAKEVFHTGSRVCAKVIVRQKIKDFSPCELGLDVQFQRRDHTRVFKHNYVFMCFGWRKRLSRKDRTKAKRHEKETKLIIKSVGISRRLSFLVYLFTLQEAAKSRWISATWYNFHVDFEAAWNWNECLIEQFGIRRRNYSESAEESKAKSDFSLRSVSRSLWKHAAHFLFLPFALPVSFVQVFKTIGRTNSLLWIIFCFTKWF